MKRFKPHFTTTPAKKYEGYEGKSQNYLQIKLNYLVFLPMGWQGSFFLPTMQQCCYTHCSKFECFLDKDTAGLNLSFLPGMQQVFQNRKHFPQISVCSGISEPSNCTQDAGWSRFQSNPGRFVGGETANRSSPGLFDSRYVISSQFHKL